MTRALHIYEADISSLGLIHFKYHFLSSLSMMGDSFALVARFWILT